VGVLDVQCGAMSFFAFALEFVVFYEAGATSFPLRS
jgi:hypothetical protein